MVEAPFSSNQCKSFSLWPVGIAYTGTENEKRLQLQFSSFNEPACGWLCRVALPHLSCPILVSAAPGQSPCCYVPWPLLCPQLPSACSVQSLGGSIIMHRTCSNDSISRGTISCHSFRGLPTSARAVLELGGDAFAMALIKARHTGF